MNSLLQTHRSFFGSLERKALARSGVVASATHTALMMCRGPDRMRAEGMHAMWERGSASSRASRKLLDESFSNTTGLPAARCPASGGMIYW